MPTAASGRPLPAPFHARAEEGLGPVDILVNNAGTADSAPFMRSDPALFQRMIDMHLLAVVHTTQALLPGMLERGYGHVVNVASIAAKTGRMETEAVQSILDNAGQPRIITADQVAAAVIALCTAPDGAASGQAVVLDGTQR